MGSAPSQPSMTPAVKWPLQSGESVGSLDSSGGKSTERRR